MIRGGNATILVTDMDRAIRFYVETLGMKLVMDASPHWAEIDAGLGFKIALHGPAKGDAPKPGAAGSISVGFEVASLDDAVAIFENRGVSFKVTKNDHVQIAYFSDPDGNALYISQAPPPR